MCVHVCVCICVYVRVYAYVRACVYVYMYAFVCVVVPENLWSKIICESFLSTRTGERLISLAMWAISTQLMKTERNGESKEMNDV